MKLEIVTHATYIHIRNQRMKHTQSQENAHLMNVIKFQKYLKKMVHVRAVTLIISPMKIRQLVLNQLAIKQLKE
jgi:hypothetical protein